MYGVRIILRIHFSGNNWVKRVCKTRTFLLFVARAPPEQHMYSMLCGVCLYILQLQYDTHMQTRTHRHHLALCPRTPSIHWHTTHWPSPTDTGPAPRYKETRAGRTRWENNQHTTTRTKWKTRYATYSAYPPHSIYILIDGHPQWRCPVNIWKSLFGSDLLKFLDLIFGVLHGAPRPLVVGASTQFNKFKGTPFDCFQMAQQHKRRGCGRPYSASFW